MYVGSNPDSDCDFGSYGDRLKLHPCRAKRFLMASPLRLGQLESALSICCMWHSKKSLILHALTYKYAHLNLNLLAYSNNHKHKTIQISYPS